MSIFYPDNDKRITRVTQLATQCEDFISQSSSNFNGLQATLATLNQQITDAYKAANITLPPLSKLDISKELQNITDPTLGETILNYFDLLSPLGLYGASKYFGPSVTRLLIRAGAYTEEEAATAIGWGITSSWASVAGRVLAGTAFLAITAGINAYEGSEERDQLREGIQTFLPLRVQMKVSAEKTTMILVSAQAVANGLVAIGTPTVEQIQNVVQNVTNTIVPKANGITEQTVIAELAKQDKDSGSYTDDDDPSTY